MRPAKLAAFALGLVLCASAAARADAPATSGPVGIPAPQYRIKPGYATQLVAKKAEQLHGRFGKGWKVTLSAGQGPIGGSSLKFTARVNWGKGPHIMIAVPQVTGTVNMRKAPGAPRGLDRVTVLTPAAH